LAMAVWIPACDRRAGPSGRARRARR
jgi:hypothetical protein